jgi:hypothetical protein
LTVEGVSGKITDIGGRKLCFLRIYRGNARIQEVENGGGK